MPLINPVTEISCRWLAPDSRRHFTPHCRPAGGLGVRASAPFAVATEWARQPMR